MKTRSYTKELTVLETPFTKEDLEKSFLAYEPVSVKDFIITCMAHVTATRALERGSFKTPGTYEITDIWFSKRAPWYKVICQVRKIS
jgi:hypothetical protein